MDEKLKKIIKILQDDIPIVKRPFKLLAEKNDLEEEELINAILDLMDKRIIRHFGAIIKHTKVGYKSNAMLVMKIDENKIDESGNLLASFNEVSHCYHRVSKKEWPYNLYVMVHAKGEDELQKIIEKILNLTKPKFYKILPSLKEFKKDSMKYI